MRVDEVVRAAAAGLGCALVLSGAVSAQEYDRGRNVSVLERERKDYDAIGVHAGGFSIFPRLDTRVVYSSNVFAAATNEVSDHYVALTPTVEARSNWNRHQLQAEGGLRLKRYADRSSENQDGWFLRTNGRLDIHGDSYATALLQRERLYEERGEPDASGLAAEPLPIDAWQANLRGVGQFNRLRLGAGVVYRDLDFQNVPRIGGGVFGTAGRDRNSRTYDVKAEWAISPDTAVFGQLVYADIDYGQGRLLDTSGVLVAPDRDSKETGVLLGANFDLSALVRGEVGAGYVRRKYQEPTFRDVSGLSVKGMVEYFPTQLTTVTANARRTVEDSIQTNASGFFATGAGVRVDHEFRRNILLNAAADYETQEYDGIDRTDKVTTLSAGATYLVNRTVGVNASVGRVSRDSSGAQQFRSYDELRASIGVILQR